MAKSLGSHLEACIMCYGCWMLVGSGKKCEDVMGFPALGN